MRLVKPNTTMMEFKEKPMDKTPTRSIKSLILPVKLPMRAGFTVQFIKS